MSSDIVKFTKLRTTTDVTFWSKFTELKIDKLKLDENAKILLWGSFSLQSVNKDRLNPLILDYTSFNKDMQTTSHKMGVVYRGYMVNKNTLEAYKRIDPELFIDNMGKCVLENIVDGTALQEPWRLSTFLLFAFSDLKKYKFYYWVAHPTPFYLPEMHFSQPTKSAATEFSTEQMDKLYSSFLQLDAKLRNFFVVFVSGKNDLNIATLSEGVEYVKSNINNEKDSDQEKKDIYFAFYDPCSSKEPGWPLRNLLCLLLWHCPQFYFTQDICILSLRGEKIQSTLIYSLRSKEDENQEMVRNAIFTNRLVGWEANANGKMGPNIANLSYSMDPSKVSDRAINLNLKLMKWRLVPELDLEKINNLRCLLLGVGTLGCSVARVLLGWGISKMTLVDNSVVSHSNTVRQSLYTHEDAMKRRHKAFAARDALLRIRPNMEVYGVALHIPMPGHVISEGMRQGTEKAVNKLQELVDSHDVVFLLLDSREARWFPTLLCATMNKIAINAALGFDSYTVQRHGARNLSESISFNLNTKNPSGQDLGCYFCNDVTQPGNSQTDRTLDQQCTVSRPGLSQIAAGFAVELLIALTQHSHGVLAQALTNNDADNSQKDDSLLMGILGGIPHTIRGSLWNQEMKLTITHKFSSCMACSMPIIKEYQQRGFAFVLDACNMPNYLERLSGIEELLKKCDIDKLCDAMDALSEDE